MKRFFSVILMLLSVQWGYGQVNTTRICGEIDELKAGEVISLAYYTNRLDYQVQVVRTRIKKGGAFCFEIPLDQARFFHLKYQDILSEEFFVAPKDDLKIQTNLYNDFIEIIEGVDLVTKIQRPAYKYDRSEMKKQQKKCLKSPNRYFSKKRKDLIPSKTYSPFFPSYVQCLIDYQLAYEQILFTNSISALDTLNLNDTLFLSTEPYQSLVISYMQYHYQQKYPDGEKNRFPTKYELGEKMLKGETKEFYQATLLYNMVQEGELENNRSLWEQFMKNAHYQKYIQALSRQQESTAQQPLLVGRHAPTFELKDRNDYTVPLNSFEGKVVFLDFWATWCPPCREEIPHFEKLQQEYQGKEIVFISISVDKSAEKWKKMLDKENMGGVHLRIDFAEKENIQVLKNYQVTSVPRYLLIDKKGNLSAIQAPRPSHSRQIRRIIDSLLEE